MHPLWRRLTLLFFEAPSSVRAFCKSSVIVTWNEADNSLGRGVNKDKPTRINNNNDISNSVTACPSITRHQLFHVDWTVDWTSGKRYLLEPLSCHATALPRPRNSDLHDEVCFDVSVDKRHPE